MVFFNRTTSSTNYAPPTVTGIFKADGVTLITDASANGDETIVLLGKNFGPVGTVQIDKVTFGLQGRQFFATDCKITVASTRMECKTPPSIGQDLISYVTIGSQTSSTSLSKLSFKAPYVAETSSKLIDTRGGMPLPLKDWAGQPISFTGTDYGLKIEDLKTLAVFGEKILLATKTEQLTDGQDQVQFNFPELTNMRSPFQNVNTILQVSTGSVTMKSNEMYFSYAPPAVAKIYTYEGTKAALRIVVVGKNFCGKGAMIQSTEDCGTIKAFDRNNEIISEIFITKWGHNKVEFECNAAKGNFRIAVGSESYSYKYSAHQSFEHKSPVIDNKDTVSEIEHPTEGGTIITVEGKYMRRTNVEIWVGNAEGQETKGQVIKIHQNSEKGPQYYTLTCKIPPGQGRNNNLFVRLPASGAGLASSDSEPANLHYMPPTAVVMASHHAPTINGSVIFSGTNMGICAFLMFDGKIYGDVCTNVTKHESVVMKVPEGDGTDHVLSLSIGGEVIDDVTGWKSEASQCNSGKGLGQKFGWFEYDAPKVVQVSPATSETVGKTIITITGKNFGVFNGRGNAVLQVQMLSSNAALCNECNAALKPAFTAGNDCTASPCRENPGCGCFESTCNCCLLASNCRVISYTHTSITCEIDEGQGINLEVVVNAVGQTSSGKKDLFAYEPPNITSVVRISKLEDKKNQSSPSQSNNIYAPTIGGDLYQINGTSFGTSGAMIELIGDDKTTGPFSQTLGPFSVVSQTHNSVIFRLPPGHGQGRHVRLIVGEQSNTFLSNTFNYIKPTLTKIEQPEPCTTISRTTFCGSPTIGGFKMTLHGDNFGPSDSTTATILTIGGTECCHSCVTVVGQENKCTCCVESRDHTSITIIAPPYNSDGEYLFGSTGVPVEVDYNYLDWKHLSTINYDAPWINYVNPPIGNAQGQEILIQGINFGHVSGMNVEKIQIGNMVCNNTRWTGASSIDEAISCYLPMDRVGPKTVTMTVAGQTSIWDSSEWSVSGGKRVYSTSCPVDFYGRDGEFCFECPFAVSEEGNPLIDKRGYKEYLGKCIGGDNDPLANKGFYKMQVYKQCGNTGFPCSESIDCFNYSQWDATEDGIDAIDPGICSITHAKNKEYCNKTMLETRNYCIYILACDPSESCKAANKCSIVPEDTINPVTKEEIRSHGYSNTTRNGGKYVQRCTACARGYFRVGGLCEQCPKNIKLIAALFICGIIGACVVGYVMNRYKVNLAIAAIGIDYAQVLSMFLKSQIPWPSAIRTLFRILSAFNFDLDIASPECLVPDVYRFDVKWYCIMGMPLCVAIVFLGTHFCIVIKKRLKGRTQKLNKHAHAMISMNLVMMYFLYLYVTRNALDVFNCTPLNPIDPVHPEYTYMAAVGGELCYQEGGLQMVLIPYAVLGILFYTIGYPCLLGWLFWKNRRRIQRDQYLRAMGADVVRDLSDKFNIYNIRKRYSHLYYQFKPRSYYWTVVIIARKFSIAFVNLMLRQNVEYMLAASLLIMFVAFTCQVHILPYMGPAEHANVLKKWGERTRAVTSGKFSNFTFPTKNLDEEKKQKQNKKRKKNRRISTVVALKIKSSGTKCCQKLVNYNVVEAVLLACAVLIMLAGIMFSSDRFENGKNRDELGFLTWLTLLIIIASLGYYVFVLSLEVSAQLCPVYCQKSCCDLEKHFGENYTTRHLRKAKKKKEALIAATSNKPGSVQIEMMQNPTSMQSNNSSSSSLAMLSTLSSQQLSKFGKQGSSKSNKGRPGLKKKKNKKKQNNDADELMINPINSGTDLESPRKTLKRINSYKEHTTEDGKSYYSSVDNPKEVVWALPKDGEVAKTESPRKALKRINSYKEHTTGDGKSYYSSVDNPKEVVWTLPKDGEVVKTESPRKAFKRINSYKKHTTGDGKSYYSSVDNPKEVVWVLPKDGEVAKTTIAFSKTTKQRKRRLSAVSKARRALSLHDNESSCYMPVVDKADDVNEDTAIEVIDAENVEITELQRTTVEEKEEIKIFQPNK